MNKKQHTIVACTPVAFIASICGVGLLPCVLFLLFQMRSYIWLLKHEEII